VRHPSQLGLAAAVRLRLVQAVLQEEAEEAALRARGGEVGMEKAMLKKEAGL
jgi:hypothetical protein